jgi:hypothetical protein
LACLVFVGGLAIGTASNAPPVRAQTHAGGYRILSGDFHVHGFPGDGGLPPWSLREEARFAGIDVFGQTNHNQALTGRLGEWVAAGQEPLVVTGEEITNQDYHLIAIGISTAVSADQPAASAIADVHAQGGVAIAAHPIARFQGWDDDAVAMLDGVEVAHPIIHSREGARGEMLAFYQRARRLNPGIAAIGSSDMHTTATLADCRTLVFVRDATRAGVLDAIRMGRTVAMDRTGALYGPADLVRLVEAARPVGRVDPHPKLRRASVGLAVAGLLGMMLLGQSRGGSKRTRPTLSRRPGLA